MNRTLPAAALTVVAALALAGCTGAGASSPSPSPSATALPAGTYAIDCDSSASVREDAITVLGPDTYRLGGWSHIRSVGAFKTVARPVGDYRIDSENYVADDSCAGNPTLSVILVKKTHDWDRQHANGLESQFPTDGLTFGDVTDITLELRLRPEVSSIPSASMLKVAYGDLLSDAELAAFDNGHVNLELTLFGSGATADSPFMNAGVLIDVDPAEFGDGWVRVKVPREQLTFYTEDNYVRAEVGADEYQDLRVQGLRINPETSSSSTVRNYVGDAFDAQSRPELFKEMGIAFALIEVGRSPQEDAA